MPAYCFKCESCGNSESITRTMSKSDMPLACPKCSKGMIRDYLAEAPGRRARCDTYPMVSSAAGGHVDDTKRMMADDKELGIRETQYTDGDPIFRSKGHRKEYLEKHKMFDRNAGYGDPCPKNR